MIVGSKPTNQSSLGTRHLSPLSLSLKFSKWRLALVRRRPPPLSLQRSRSRQRRPRPTLFQRASRSALTRRARWRTRSSPPSGRCGTRPPLGRAAGTTRSLCSTSRRSPLWCSGSAPAPGSAGTRRRRTSAMPWLRGTARRFMTPSSRGSTASRPKAAVPTTSASSWCSRTVRTTAAQ
eukprot:Amastigsp_a345603_17.p3 type:complete len:178 gc:universal Amastigsp_a345603_17:1119-586(-)